MNLRREIGALTIFSAIFIFLYIFPAEDRIFQGLREGILLLRLYAQEHVLYCLIPAFFVAGAIGTFISKQAVLKYLGPSAPKILSFAIASVAGTILAVCSCTVLPLFAGLYLRGAGLGPAVTFLYSGPAINVLAIILTARILGLELGLARVLGAISMGIILGIVMHFLFRKSERERETHFVEVHEKVLPLSQSLTLLGTLLGILIFAISRLPQKELLLYLLFLLLLFQFYLFYKTSLKIILFTISIVTFTILISPYREIPFVMGTVLVSYIANSNRGPLREWFDNTYILAKQIFPFLFIGVFLAGFFFGGYEGEGFVPKTYVEKFIGGTSFFTHLLVALLTALMYFATLTEIPILQGLLNQGVKMGPALAMLLAGPAVSLPSLLVLRTIIGLKKTLAYALLVVLMSSIYGYLFLLLRY